MNLHFWRKICVNCKCRKEHHDLEPDEYGYEHFDILGVKIPDHKNLYKYASKSQHGASAPQIVEWTPPIAGQDTAKREETLNKYFEDLGDDAIPFKNSNAAIKRKEMASYQIPAHDFSAEKCDNLTEEETQQLNKYVENAKKIVGQGEIGVVEVIPAVKPSYAREYQQLSSFRKPLNADTINNNLTENIRSLTLEHEIKCRGCQLPITSSYVKAEKMGPLAKWHPKCFKCFNCSELLVDLIYFHYDNEIYCARDLALKMEIPRCAACDELILVTEYTLADGKNYHIKHFSCFHCDLPLAGKQYVCDDKTNLPLCLNCYDQHYATLCNSCGQAIAPNDQGVSFKDVHFHLNCFKCGFCSKELIGGRFCLRNKIPFCSAACVSGANA